MNTTKIVVGVDGSPPSLRALDWALQQAELTCSYVHAITAWEYPSFYTWEGGTVPPSEFENAAGVTLDNAVHEVVGRYSSPPAVETEILQGDSAEILLDAAKSARLLVVGSRGHGAFMGVLIGSVSQKCAHYAPCPIVLIPGPLTQ